MVARYATQQLVHLGAFDSGSAFAEALRLFSREPVGGAALVRERNRLCDRRDRRGCIVPAACLERRATTATETRFRRRRRSATWTFPWHPFCLFDLRELQ
jgi:hypothetical protein